MAWQGVVSTVALIVSIGTFLIVFVQMRIASSKVQLDLYTRRFEIYQAALDLYQAIWDWKWETIQPLEKRFIRAFRESQFLFDAKDGIYETLEKIKDCNSIITADEKARGRDSSDSDPQSRKIFVGRAGSASIDFDVLLRELEGKMHKYLDFRSISGWRLY